eukprot:COSAG04_NODE_435_length_14466_cov_135.545486_10_plen_126_part_00
MEYGGEILMLTWQSSLGLAFDAETLEPTREFTTPMPDGEPTLRFGSENVAGRKRLRTQRRRRFAGWGLTVAGDGTLLGTDSSAELYTMAMAEDGGLEEKHRVTIRDGRRKVRQHPIYLIVMTERS